MIKHVYQRRWQWLAAGTIALIFIIWEIIDWCLGLTNVDAKTKSSQMSSVWPGFYYTIQSNIIIMIWFLGAAFLLFATSTDSKSTNFWFSISVKSSVTLWIAITGFVGIFVITPMNIIAYCNGSMKFNWLYFIGELTLHYIIPIYAIIDFIKYPITKTEYNKPAFRWPIIWFVYPFIYAIIVNIYGACTGNYLYPFFDPTQFHTLGWWGVVILMFVIFCVYTIICFLCYHRLKIQSKKTIAKKVMISSSINISNPSDISEN